MAWVWPRCALCAKCNMMPPLQDSAGAREALDQITQDAIAEVQSQGITDIIPQPRAHLRYDGSHQALDVPFGGEAEMLAAFEDTHRQRFGFHSPERSVLFEMLSVEAVGQTGQTPAADLPVGNGEPKAMIPMHADGIWADVPLYDRANLHAPRPVPGPAVITEPTGTNVIEPGWSARLDKMGNLLLERVEEKRSAQAAGTKADPVLLEVFNNLFMSVADQMGATLANTSWSVNIKERLDFSCAIFDDRGDLVANAPHVPVHLGSMSDSVKTIMRLNPDARPGDAYMLNSPYNGGTHLPDVTVITPVFVQVQASVLAGLPWPSRRYRRAHPRKCPARQHAYRRRRCADRQCEAGGSGRVAGRGR